jgi:hypothetical protein
MNASRFTQSPRFKAADAARAQVATYLYELYTSDEGMLANLDCWTQRRITDESMAKIALVFESDDPAETCYRDLIREISNEAEHGIYLASASSSIGHLRRIVDEPGVSGELADHIEAIAENMFPDELAASNTDLDLLWSTIRARHDRAHVDAVISEIIIGHLMGDADMARDMCDALRSLLYAFHENVTRRCSNLNLLGDEREERDLMIMVGELEKRCEAPRQASILQVHKEEFQDSAS